MPMFRDDERGRVRMMAVILPYSVGVNN